MRTKPKDTGDIIIYSQGIVALSVCVNKTLKKEFIEEQVNKIAPTGISSKWKISKDKTFKGGKPNPCACDEHPNKRLHYLMNC